MKSEREHISVVEQTVEAAKKVLDMDNSDVLCGRLIESFEDQFGDESFCKIGRAVLRQYIAGSEEVRGAMDYLFVTLCGWTLTSLMKRSRLMDDTDGTFDGLPADYECID